jgi:hypothetical protein
MKQSRAPLIVAIVLLLLPVLYVGSYLALVVPEGISMDPPGLLQLGSGLPRANYRFVDRTAARIYWPLEQIDRKLRPGRWEWWRPLTSN